MTIHRPPYHTVSCFLAVIIVANSAPAQDELDYEALVALDKLTSAEAAMTTKIDYYILNQPVADFLHALERDLNLRFDVSNQVRGTLADIHIQGTVEEALDQLCSVLGLEWFRFNDVVYLSSRAEAMTRLTRLGDLVPDKVIEELTAAGLLLENYPAMVVSDGQALAISGPPKMLALTEAVIDSMPEATPSVIQMQTPPAEVPRTVTVRRAATSVEIVRIR